MSDSFIKLQNKPVQETPNLIVLRGRLFLHHLTIQTAPLRWSKQQFINSHSCWCNVAENIHCTTMTPSSLCLLSGQYFDKLCQEITLIVCGVSFMCCVLKVCFSVHHHSLFHRRCEIMICPSAGAHTVLSLGFFFYTANAQTISTGFFFSYSSMLHGIQGQPHFF